MGLKDKLGPISWQFMSTKKFDPVDFAAFLKLLPKEVDGRAIRHVVEVRHESFRVPEFVAMVRDRGVAVALAADADYPQIADITAPFVYARIMGTRETEPLGYSTASLNLWAQRAKQWAMGDAPTGLDLVTMQQPDGAERDVYLYVISGDKARNPAAAKALIERLN